MHCYCKGFLEQAGLQIHARTATDHGYAHNRGTILYSTCCPLRLSLADSSLINNKYNASIICK